MWKNIRKKINDFIFEEIEEELEVDAQYGQDVHRIQHDTQSIRTKVAYQYPENEEAKFRFPVIPDQQNEQEQKQQPVMDEIKKRPQRMRRRKPIPLETHDDVEPLILGYRRHKKVNEIEEVPAYVRRNREKQREEERLQEEKRLQRRSELEQKVENNIGHTTPDELDAVFRKRDGKISAHDDASQTNRIDSDEHERSRRTSESKQTTHFPSFQHETEHLTNETIHAKSARMNEQEQKRAHRTLQRKSNVAKRERINVQFDDEEDVIHVKQSDNDRERLLAEKEQMNRHVLHEQQREKQQVKRSMLTFEQGKDDTFQQVATTNIEHKPKTEDVYTLPDELLNDPRIDHNKDEQWLQEQRKLLEQTLTYFKIDATVVHVTQGPSVTRFEIQPALGVKVSRIRNLADDFKLNMAAKDIRIEAPIPGKNTVGIEVPNKTPQVVTLQEIIETDLFKEATSPLAIALGVTIEGEPLVTNIGEMPHGLIAGATGSGKSVCINSIILSLLYKATPNEVKLMLIDPKMVELTPYNGIPHLLSPVITDPQAATKALKWAVDEMERRYELFVAAGVRNIVKYNEIMSRERLPYIVIIIDELADLMLVSPQEVEDAICRIAQKARACGIHLLLATQRPSVDVITGLIKANIPTRIAFSVSSQVDSRTIIDTNGAEKLLGKGDMLFVPNGANKRLRLQGPFVSDDEVDRVVSYVRSTGEPNYVFEEKHLLLEIEAEEEDELLLDAIYFVIEQGSASTSLLQRQFRIGYNRAARLIDTLYNMGIVSGQNGTKPRDILVTKADLEELL